MGKIQESKFTEVVSRIHLLGKVACIYESHPGS